MLKRHSHILLNYGVKNQNVNQLKDAFNCALYNNFPSKYVGNKFIIENLFDKSEQKGIVYNQQLFLRYSFLNFVIDDLAAANNQPYVIKYLESLGFDEISVEKRTNPHNGRKNVWMIKMKKR